MVMWIVNLVVLLGAVLLVVSGNYLLAGVILLAATVTDSVVSSIRRRRIHAEFRERFPNSDDVARALDREKIRRLRDNEGKVQAVRQARRDVPGLPLVEAANLVDKL
ncbi:hypothetical protein SAMN04487905_1116 [Actinopolyspora xinjiangensis]|uniref:Uncharacterized protein n=2 Tax=Actinopolyspora xinjiangensis TaxID=405564 RepID=A0A1H0W792_9ACTN|nr:hypothetical protein SAMN04487905_1116 [Actinopolyspora xinjiangensis]